MLKLDKVIESLARGTICKLNAFFTERTNMTPAEQLQALGEIAGNLGEAAEELTNLASSAGNSTPEFDAKLSQVRDLSVQLKNIVNTPAEPPAPEPEPGEGEGGEGGSVGPI